MRYEPTIYPGGIPSMLIEAFDGRAILVGPGHYREEFKSLIKCLQFMEKEGISTRSMSCSFFRKGSLAKTIINEIMDVGEENGNSNL